VRVSKFVKLNTNILLEYIYDDSNNIGYPYKVLINNQNNQNNLSFIDGTVNTGRKTNNTLTNQLFRIDVVNNTFGKIDTSAYPFLQLKDYPEGFPLRHDTIKIHLPINYVFDEFIGFYIRIFTFDFNNKKTYELSNFYFDITDVEQSQFLDLSNPSLLFQEKLWGKNIRIDIPSVDQLSQQRTQDGARTNSVNFNLTNGFGLSNTSPIFIDFHFIRSKKKINNITTYSLTSKFSTSLPQKPDFEKLGLRIEHARRGDYFEIFGIYNGNVTEFNNFILDSINYGKKYVVEYNITLFEQNIRGKSFKILIESSFNEKVEFRPIIKFTTTTAIIDVEMNVIDIVDGSMIQRRASYGMLQDEVAKYSLNLTKINLSRASKPKIYNIKSPEGAGIFGNLNGSAYSDGRLYGNAGGSLFSTNNTNKNIFGLSRGSNDGSGVFRNSGVGSAFVNDRFGSGGGVVTANGNGGGLIDASGITNENGLNQIANSGFTKVILEPYPVHFKVFANLFNIVAKSDSVIKGKNYFYGSGKLKIVLKPFDNFIKFILAESVSPSSTSTPVYMDLTNMGDIKLVFKNTKNTVEFGLYLQTQEVDLSRGVLVFKISQNKINEIRQIYNSGINPFYITTTKDKNTSNIFEGLFTLYDDIVNINLLNQQQSATEENLQNDGEGFVVEDPNNQTTGTAVVTRRVLPGRRIISPSSGAQSLSSNGQTQNNNGSSTNNLQNSSSSSTIIQGTNNFQITTDSSLIINEYTFLPVIIKKAYNSESFIRDLTFQQANSVINLYEGGRLLDPLQEAIIKLEKQLSTAQLVVYKQKTGVSFATGQFSKPNTSGAIPDPQNSTNSTTNSQTPGQYKFILNGQIITTRAINETDNLKIGDIIDITGRGKFKITKMDKQKLEVTLIEDKPSSSGGSQNSA
jgi:hypothetical protein